MKAQIIDGKAVAAQIREEIQEEIKKLDPQKSPPGLAVILVGEDPASQVYVRSKGKACQQVGINSLILEFPATITQENLLKEIDRLNNDPQYHGFLVQLPLPSHIDSQKIIESIKPEKDVDCFHPFNVGRLVIGMSIFEPATPAGIVELLKRYNINTSGKHVVIVGRSNIVGKPLANLLVQKNAHANALVTVVHSAAGDISKFTREADILVAAIGRAEFIKGNMVKEGAVVIDVGVNRVDAPTPKGYRLAAMWHLMRWRRLPDTLPRFPEA